MSTGANRVTDVTIIDWAYESTPDTAISAGAVPEPGTALLGAVSSVMVALRRRRKSA